MSCWTAVLTVDQQQLVSPDHHWLWEPLILGPSTLLSRLWKLDFPDT